MEPILGTMVFPAGYNSLCPGEVHEGFSEEVVIQHHACPIWYLHELDW